MHTVGRTASLFELNSETFNRQMHSLHSQGRHWTFIPYALFTANCTNNCSRPPPQSQLNQEIIKSNFARHPSRDPGVLLLAKIAVRGIWALPSSCPVKDDRQQTRSLRTMRRQRQENSTHCPPQKPAGSVPFAIFCCLHFMLPEFFYYLVT